MPDLVQRLQYVRQRGCDVRPLLQFVLYHTLASYLAAVGASQAEWEAWTAANPPAACPLYRWVQREAAEEAARLTTALPPERAAFEPRQHSAAKRKV